MAGYVDRQEITDNDERWIACRLSRKMVEAFKRIASDNAADAELN